ncbi:unnamed protein product [Amoebophrya sp. A120]|nr:unnamed protein product [Amoebophrya sp. A120]|eukprot:GSA120T00001601001.1
MSLYKRVGGRGRGKSAQLAGDLDLPKTAGYVLQDVFPDKDDDSVQAVLAAYRQKVAAEMNDEEDADSQPSPDDDDDHGSDPNYYQVNETAADHVLVLSSVTRQLRESLRCRGELTFFASAKLHFHSSVAWLILWFVFALQGFILFKLRDITSYYSGDFTAKLVGEERGVCANVGHLKTDLDANALLPPAVWSCAPPPLDYASHWSNLDTNQDGVWSLSEAEATDKTLPRSKSSLLFEHFLGKIRDQKNPDTGEKMWEEQSKQFTVIPKEAYVGDKALTLLQKDMLILCQVLDARLCSNLELDGHLRPLFPDAKHPSQRIAKCEDLVKSHCDFFGGETYKTYQVRHGELCGEYQIRQIVGNGAMREAQFSEVVRYNNKVDGVTTITFSMFLAVILCLWLMVLLSEIKSALRMGLLLLFFPVAQTPSPAEGSSSPEDQSYGGFSTSYAAYAAPRPKAVRHHTTPKISVYTSGGKAFHILATSSVLHKLQLVFFVFLPRMFILGLLIVVGTEFLLSNFAYIDLILNAVALGFLVDVDKIAYGTFSSRDRRLLLNSVKPLRFSGTRTEGRSWQALRYRFADACSLDHGIFSLFAAVVAIGAGVALHTQFAPGGLRDVAHALKCFCTMDGGYCLSSRKFQANANNQIVPSEDSSALVDKMKLFAGGASTALEEAW